MGIGQCSIYCDFVTYSSRVLQAPVLVTLILGVVVYALFLFWEAKVARFPIVPGTTDPLLDKCYGLLNLMQYSSSGIRPSSAFSLLHS